MAAMGTPDLAGTVSEESRETVTSARQAGLSVSPGLSRPLYADSSSTEKTLCIKGGCWTYGRERSETNCCTCRCKSCRRNSPFGAVVISGSPRGDLGGWQPGRRSLRQAEHPLGLISPGGEQPGGP